MVCQTDGREVSSVQLGSTPEQIELKRTLLLMRFFAISGNFIMVPFAMLAVWQGIWIRFWILLLVICVVTSLVVSAHVRQQTRGARIALALVLCLFALHLTLSGGQDGTGLLLLHPDPHDDRHRWLAFGTASGWPLHPPADRCYSDRLALDAPLYR